MKHGKKYIDAAKLIENNKTYDPPSPGAVLQDRYR